MKRSDAAVQSIAKELKKKVREKEEEKRKGGKKKKKGRLCEFPRNLPSHHRTMTRLEVYGSQAAVADLRNLFGSIKSAIKL